jgi:hypothetical protein
LLLVAKPALQRAFAGQHGQVGAAGQTHPDVAGAPGRVLLTQRQGCGVERVIRGRVPGTRPVGRFQTLRLVAKTLKQLTDRPGAEVQSAGDGRSGLAAACPSLDKEAEG